MSELDELQTRVAFQEQTLLELDDALRSQQQQIMNLEKLVVRLQNELRALAATAPAMSAQDEPPPPHY